MINPFRQKAEEAIDKKAQRKRDGEIARVQSDLEVKEQSQGWSRRMTEGRDRWAAEEQEKVRKQLVEVYGEVAEQINLRVYHLLSLEGQRSCFLFPTRDRLEDARIVVERAGFGIDGYEAHIPVHARDLADSFDGQILAVAPTDTEIIAIAKRLDERAQKASPA